jgi:sortase A
VLVVSGAVVAGVAIFEMTFGDQNSASQQQHAAEVEPLVTSSDQVDGELHVGDVFAKIRIPRFGEDYVRNIAEGTSVSKVLNTVGIGHYLGTAMPGEVGNFALAGHRAGNGGPMRLIDRFQIGDQLTVETANGIFNYRYLQSTIVSPEAVGVIAPVPEGLKGAVANGKYLTLTTCTPIYVNTDRYVAWFELID